MSEDFKYKPTTALWKVKKLIKEGLPQFTDDQQQVFIIEGGQGAGKTIALNMLIADTFSRVKGEMTICSAQLSKLKATALNDFKKIMQNWNLYEDKKFNIAESIYKKADDWFLEFIGLDKTDIGKGRRRKIVFINEANKITLEQFTDITARAELVLIDHNPDANYWAHDLITDFNYIRLTYNDNEFIPKNELRNILNYRRRGFHNTGLVRSELFEKENIKSKYWANKWRVYGLGEIGSIDGAIFENYEVIKMPEEARLLYYGCDFGYATSKLAIVGVYNWNGKKVLKQFIYETKKTNQEGAKLFKERGYNGGYVYCDSAEPKSIREMQIAGIKAIKCGSKQDIKGFAIQELNTDTFYVDEESTDLINELRYYIYDEKTGKPKKSDKDHLMDALLYAVGSENKLLGKYF